MSGVSDQFITRMKLRELRMQRDQSLAAYAQLDQEVAMARSAGERIRVLYEGLRRLRFAKQPLHPDVTNLEPILHDVATGRASAETVAYWQTHLEQELAQGRMRAEIVYIFGALLEEWTKDDLADAQQKEAQRLAQAELLQDAAQPAKAGTHEAFLDALFAATNLNDSQILDHVRKTVRETIYASVSPAELKGVLARIRNDPYRTFAIRSQAQRFLFNSTLLKELADALTIQLDHIDEWNWPQTGVRTQALWARTKWRLFLDEDLPTACLLELLGLRWQQVLTQTFNQYEELRARRVRQRFAREGREDSLGYMLVWGVDLWEETAQPVAEISADAPATEQLKYMGEYGSIYEQRADMQRHLRGFEHFDGYRDDIPSGGLEGGMDSALTLINAEITLARAAFPGKPFYVTKIDLKIYYPSIPHDALLHILARLGSRRLTGSSSAAICAPP